MSATQTATDDVQDRTPPPADDIEARARKMGWKPAEEYRGPAGGWRDAAEFVRRGEEELPIIRERYRATERKLVDVEKRLGDATSVITDLTDRFRTADERAYRRAKADLERERMDAVATGDTKAFERADAELRELDKSAPKPPVVRDAPAAPAAPDAVHPDAAAWDAENPWFRSHPDLREAAMEVHTRLLRTHPTLSVKENLARVTAAMAALDPDRVSTSQRAAPPPENPRREAPADVSSSTPARQATRGNGRTFDAMPKDSKEAYTKYAKSLEGKGKALTKDEWASDYWAQFEE